MRVKVQVGEDKFLIPVPEEEAKNIAWLINEVATRLQKKLKVDSLPEITELTLEDGSSLSPDDAIKGLIESNDLLIAKLSSPVASSATNNNAKDIARAVLEESENLAKKKAQEPIVECVQCGAEFRESENPEGGCKWHTEGLDNSNRTKCCSQRTSWRDRGFLEQYTAGCQRGKHRATHHEDYAYRNYTWWANSLLRNMKTWAEIDRKDFNDQGSGWRKYAKIGLHSGKLVIALGVNYTPKYIRQFSDLKEIAAKELSDEKLGWKISVTPHKQNSGEVFVDLTVKCASDSQPETVRVVVSYNEASKEFSVGANVEKLSIADVPIDTSKIYDLPPAKFSGKRIHRSLFEKGPTPRTFTATGDLPLKLFVEEGKKVRPCQSTWGGKFKNIFETPLMFAHESDDVTTVTSVKGEFFVNGEWVPASQTFLGYDGWNSPSYENTLPAVFDGKQSAGKLWANLHYEFPSGTVQQRDNDNHGRAWCHTGLGNPLQMRFTLIGVDGKTKSIELEHVNPPLDTIATDEKTFFSLECDNTIDLRIPYTKFSLKKGEEYWLEFKNGSTTNYKDDILMRWAWEAKNANQTEFKLDDLSKNNNDETIEVFALVDVAVPRVWGFKAHIKSATGEAEDSFQFWKEDPAKTRVSSKINPVDWKPEYLYEPATPTPNAN